MAIVGFEKVSEAFDAVIAARAAGVAVDDLLSLCGGDASVAAEVRSLLEHLDQVEEPSRTGSGGGFLDCDSFRESRDDAAAGPLHGEWGAASVGQKVGPYTLLTQLGAGGMAVVFVAEQDKPRRNVALKLVRRNTANEHLVRRFELEAELHGSLSHPGIAQVYNAGVATVTDAAGHAVDTPYLAMELVQGVNIAEFCRAFGNRQEMVLGLVAQVCDAVQHAHQRGVIHRDLKPANVLVTGGSRGEATVKVLDFGVARFRNAQLDRDAITRLTQHGSVLGTLAYMSPEQLGASADVDTRGDVYALGVILFELLAGRQPIDLSGCGLAEAAVRITQTVPPRLGTVDRVFRGDVETIVAKAMDKDPDRRYQSPAELAEDLRHTLAGEPIQARRDSITYTLTRQVVRYRAIALAATTMLLLLVIGAGYVHREQTLKLRSMAGEAEALGRERVARRDADTLAGELAARLSASRIAEGRLLSAGGAWIDAERPLWDEYLAHPDSLDARWALRDLYRRSGCRATIDTRSREARCLAAGDGLLAVGGTGGVVRLWRTADGQPAGEVDSKLSGVRAACFVGDRPTLALAGTNGACLATPGGTMRKLAATPAQAVAASKSLLAVGDDDGRVRLFTPAGERIAELHAATTPVRGVAIDTAETHLATIHNDGSMRLWRIDRDGRGGPSFVPGPPLAGHATQGRTVAFSPDGRTIASGAGDQFIRLWRTSDGRALAAERTRNGTSRDVVFDSTGYRLAVAGYWRTQIFDLAPDTSKLTPARGIDGESLTCRFADEGNTLLTLASAGVCRVWDLSPPGPVVLRGTSTAAVNEMAVTRTGDRPLMVVTQGDGTVSARSLSAAGQWELDTKWSPGYATHGIAIDARAGRVWLGRDDGGVLAHDLSSGAVVDRLPDLGQPVRTVTLSPDGRTLVVGLGDGRVTFWRHDGRQWAKTHEGQLGLDVRGAALSRDGRTLVTTHRMAFLRTWSMDDFRVLGDVSRPTASYQADFSPDGRRVAAGDWDRSVHVWDTAAIGPAARPRLTLVGHQQLVNEVAFDETGTLLASVATDGQWRLWDASGHDAAADTGQRERHCLLSEDAESAEAVIARFVPDGFGGQCVAVGYRDGSVRVWSLTAGDRYVAHNIDYQRGLRKPPTTRP